MTVILGFFALIFGFIIPDNDPEIVQWIDFLKTGLILLGCVLVVIYYRNRKG